MVSISLDIKDELYDKLNEISEKYGNKFEDSLVEILEVMSYARIYRMENGKAPELRSDIIKAISLAEITNNTIYDRLLNQLEAGDKYILQDMEIDFDDNSMMFDYWSQSNCPFYVDNIHLGLTGLKTMIVECLVEVNVDNAWIQEKVQSKIEKREYQVPEIFHGLDFWQLDLKSESDDSFGIVAEFTEENLAYLPSIPVISKLFEQILEGTGVLRPREINQAEV